MHARQILGTALLSALLTTAALAEDTDLFLTEYVGNGLPPNLLFVLDNSANWNASLGASSKKEMEHEALYRVLTDSAYTGKVRAGLMSFASSNNPKGGKVNVAVKTLDATEQENWKFRLYDNGRLDGEERMDGANNAPYALSINEAWRYYSGLSPMSGVNDGDHDPLAVSGGKYASPAQAHPCSRNYIVLIGNGGPDSGENNDAEEKLSLLGGRYPTDPITISPVQYMANWADEYARYVSASDVDPLMEGHQGAVVYVIDVFDPESNQAGTRGFKGERAWMQSIARQGKGRYFTARNTEEMVAALDEILREVAAVNNVFASTTLPVSVNVRGTNLNQVYMGVFRPDADKLPRWPGNLKMYRLAYDAATDSLFLADAEGKRADSTVTGFLLNDAVSFWTHPSSYWAFSPRGTPPSISDSPDGEVVEKGAAAQRLRESFPLRTLYTCLGLLCEGGGLLSASPLAVTNLLVTQALLGVEDLIERERLLNWLLGTDLLDEDGDLILGEVRASIHGDVIHSRPAVINYNRFGDDNDIVAFYGANDGIFHAVRGGNNPLTAGRELWGFIPAEFLIRLKRLYDNSAIGALNGPKPYFVDGSVGVYQHDADNDGVIEAGTDKVYIYLTMRRGGRLLYALDVTIPEAPRFLWKIDHRSPGFGGMGQSWSEPKVVKVAGHPNPVLIVGAGYDPNQEDANPDPAYAGLPAMGEAVYVIDAVNGALIRSFPVSARVPSAITVIDRRPDAGGYTDRAYFGDTRGNLWRLDLEGEETAGWTLRHFATLGSGLKFLYPPDVVYATGYDAILIGSGDREAPADMSQNHFFMLKDDNNFAAWPIRLDDLYDATADLSASANPLALDAAKGWRISLLPGEKVVGSAVTLAGKVYFNTNTPTPPATAESGEPLSCTGSLGTARAYAIDYLTAQGDETGRRYSVIPGGGYPPSPVPVIVELGYTDDEGQARIGTFLGTISGTQVQTSRDAGLNTIRRLYRYKNID